MHSETYVALWSQSPLPGHFSDPPRGDLLALEFGPKAAGRMEKQTTKTEER